MFNNYYSTSAKESNSPALISLKYTVHFLFIIFNLLFSKNKHANQKTKVQQKVIKNVYTKIQNSNFAYCCDLLHFAYYCDDAEVLISPCSRSTQLVKTNKQKN